MKYLLDVSTLVALLWKTHVDHPKTSAWSGGKELVLCPISELGFLRVVTSPAFNASMTQARQVLNEFLSKGVPEFIPADMRALSGHVAPSSSKITDWYLANLAHAHGIKWATLDANAKHPNAELIS